MDLTDLRREIDLVDEEMLTLFLKRMAICKQIGEEKKRLNKPVYNQAREEEILARVQEKSGALCEYSTEFFQKIMALSKTYQEQTT